MLLPMTFPKTMSPLPEMIDLTLTANSGALVPKATMVRPMSILETLKWRATEEAPSTKMSAPFIKMTKPKMSNKIFRMSITR